jgi:aromatic amino acid aminotransferase I
MTTTMLQSWGFDGYIRWLRGIKSTYKMRRNWMCDTFEDLFHLEFEDPESFTTNSAVLPVVNGAKGVTCYAKQMQGSKEAKWDEKKGLASKRGPPLVSFIPPTGE